MGEHNEIFILPDYIANQDKETIHIWKQWRAIAYKIDNHPDRFVTVAHPTNGSTNIFDCKGPVGVVVKNARLWGSSKEDIAEVERCAKALLVLKGEKGRLNARWSKKIFGKGRIGNKSVTVLQMRSAEIMDYFGRYYSSEEIRKIIQKEWNFAIKASELLEFYHKYKEKIDKLRADYVLAGKETRLATDAGRMEVLTKIAWEMEGKFEKTKSIEVSKELRAVIEQIRKEVKGEEIRLTIDGKIDINATIQANQTVHEALQKLPINMIVIGLTAAKQGINPAQLMGSLANSYYAKFNGFNKLGDKGELQLPGQYIKSYNWEEIRMKNEERVEDVEAIEVYEESLPVVEQVIVIDKKQRMLDLLKGLKEDID